MNITIRKMIETDFESLHTLLSNPEVMKYMEPPYTEEQTREFLDYALSPHGELPLFSKRRRMEPSVYA